MHADVLTADQRTHFLVGIPSRLSFAWKRNRSQSYAPPMFAGAVNDFRSPQNLRGENHASYETFIGVFRVGAARGSAGELQLESSRFSKSPVKDDSSCRWRSTAADSAGYGRWRGSATNSASYGRRRRSAADSERCFGQTGDRGVELSREGENG